MSLLMDELKQAERLRGQAGLSASTNTGVDSAGEITLVAAPADFPIETAVDEQDMKPDVRPPFSAMNQAANHQATNPAGFQESGLTIQSDKNGASARQADVDVITEPSAASFMASSAASLKPGAGGRNHFGLRWSLAGLLLLAALSFWLGARYLGLSGFTRATSLMPAASAVQADQLSVLHESVQRARLIWQAGDDAAAQAAYEQVLQLQADHVEALQVLALIARSQGQAAVAADYFRRLLRLDPADMDAELGLLGLQAAAAPQATATRLRQLMAAQPADARLPYALGNLEAAQEHWREAQQAYLQAYRLAPEQPDILFNLAVSSDALAQRLPAARFYQLALDAAARVETNETAEVVETGKTSGYLSTNTLQVHKAGFDQQRARARLAALRHHQ